MILRANGHGLAIGAHQLHACAQRHREQMKPDLEDQARRMPPRVGPVGC